MAAGIGPRMHCPHCGCTECEVTRASQRRLKRIAQLESENQRLRDLMRQAADGVRRLGKDPRFTTGSIAEGLEMGLEGTLTGQGGKG